MRIFHIGETEALWAGAEEVILQQANDHANQTELVRTTDEMMADAEPCTQTATTPIPGSATAAGLRKRRREDDSLESSKKQQSGNILFKRLDETGWMIEREAKEEDVDKTARLLVEEKWYLFGPKLNAGVVHLLPIGAAMNCYEIAKYSDINTIVVTRVPEVSNAFVQDCKALYTGEEVEL
ncbi:hypothetical protein VFPBJ_11677 [Purpureocillium lilacinum]|uniref:Uncharacterized protein n=1 Tax=Purpureocillium lilacinum TaxID=33203 RepID=A0A179EZN3_PURLI|nr:hypothetical protein VFPBJ_11677 [Purpureocillium lilacinum]